MTVQDAGTVYRFRVLFPPYLTHHNKAFPPLLPGREVLFWGIRAAKILGIADNHVTDGLADCPSARVLAHQLNNSEAAFAGSSPETSNRKHFSPWICL